MHLGNLSVTSKYLISECYLTMLFRHTTRLNKGLYLIFY